MALGTLKNGKFKEYIATADEVEKFVAEARKMVKMYGWEDRWVMPYSTRERIETTICRIADYRWCTFYTKQTLITLANKLAYVMNGWEEQELNGIAVKSVRTGKVVKVRKDEVNVYLDNGFVLA